MTDEEFYEHYGEWYPLRDETDTLVAMLSLAAARFRGGGFPETVNAIEIGWNVEGAHLMVSFVSNPEYACYGQGPFDLGVCRRGTAVVHNTTFAVPSWAFLHKQGSRDVPLLRVLDHDRVEVSGPAVVDGVGRNVFRVALEFREAVFAGISVSDPHWLIVYYNDDGGEGRLVRVSGAGVVVYPPDRVVLSREWFAEQSRAGAAGW
ncbi:MAG: hypothetical protein U0840_02750 [Gemmataceae bacterium]